MVREHITQLCPYKYHVPMNTTLGKGWVVVYNVCGSIFGDSYCVGCGLSDGRAILLGCSICGEQGELLFGVRASRRNILKPLIVYVPIG